MRLLYYITSLISSLLLAASASFGQYYFKQYQVDDGLAHNAVTAIIQDSKGLIWIGTRDGINRFDGYAFKTCENKKDKFGRIGNNVINTIAEDKNGMIWVGTGKGLFKYDPYKELFFEIDAAPKEYSNNLIIDEKNNLWFLVNFSLCKYMPAENRFEDLKTPASCIALDTDKNLWMGDNDGNISIYNSATNSTKFRIVNESLPANARSVSKIYPINNHELLIGCFKQGLKSYNTQTGEVRSLSLRSDNSDIYVRDIAPDNDGQYWIATESGIYIYDLINHASRNIKKQTGTPYALSDNAVYTICRDNRGGIWAGTYFGGVNYCSKDNSRFEKYYPKPGVNSISGEAVREICADNNHNLWIGTEDAGLNKLDLRTGEFTNYTATGKKGSISYPNIHGLLAWDNQLFIGPFLQGLEIMDLRTGAITDRFKLIGSKNDQSSDFVIAIYRTKNNKLLVGTAYHSSGLFEYDTRHKTFRRIPEIPYNSYVFDIFEDSKGNIWTGSVTQGAFYYNQATGQHGNFRFGDTVNGHIANEFAVYNIFEDSDHALWFATTGGGLIKLSADWKSTKRYTTENGLPTNVLYSILEDDSRHLWISSLKGLIRFNIATEAIKVYTRANGLITDQFNYNSAYKHTDGKMYFGSVKGMIAFDPASFDQQEPSPPTYITGFQLNNKEVIPTADKSPLNKSILYTDTIVLDYNQNNFSIEFAALNFSAPEVTRYKYVMKGLDKSWTYLSTNRKAYFTDLSQGNYEFIVQAESNIGSWVGKERKLFIKIRPPFWKSTAAYILYALLLATAIYLATRLYRQNLEKKNLRKLQLFEHEKEKEIYQAKIEFFTNITHEIQTPLTLIAGPIEWLRKKFGKDPEINKSLTIAEKNAKRLVELTSQLLDFRKTEASQFSLNFVKTDLVALLADLVNGFKAPAAANNITLDLELPVNNFMAFVDREAFIKIGTNLVSNAVKYAATSATVRIAAIEHSAEYFTINFINDGKGIPEEFRHQIFEPFVRIRGNSKPGTGIGLPIARSLTELHNGSLQLISGETDLINFELRMPVHQKFEFQLSSWKKIE
ncbi:histidine kinase [Niastella koreensis]|uniref:histidine kinase n=2 Tax=Niastella koreensis TaxID=354356 RepID=G8TIU3_NIAKG|nr:sensor histidine kinase [Niastella koreensis]AEV96437.1 integral membrane sensor signal transduction histidine kinase [Niastella koreensis GR20-10]OQP53967.1 histidine kinase [Niastella koreensis]